MESGKLKADKVFIDYCVATMAVNGAAYGMLENQMVGVAGGRIVWIRPDDQRQQIEAGAELIGGQGRLLTPGLIDCHTHLVYGGNRAKEWEARLGGTSYEEIARSGGGILSSVRATRDASEDELVQLASVRLQQLMAEGVTTVEIKSGYGLDLETELKMLRAARRLEDEFPVRIETTLLAAHAVPPEFKGRSDDYLDLVCREMIPAASDLCGSVDVFCESIAFDLKQTERVFLAAKEAGLKIKVHAEQLSNMGAATLAAEMGALSADHLEYLSAGDCQVLGQHDMVATLLPGAFYCLKETQKPPVVELQKYEVPIAIATDSNPGSSPVTSLLLMGNMACNLFGMTPEAALTGMTRSAATALGLDGEVGTIEVGKHADLVDWDVGSPSELVYAIGANPCIARYKSGVEVEGC